VTLRLAPGLAAGLAAALLAPATAPDARASWRPQGLEVRLFAGHDSNLLDASDAEREAFRLGDPDALFVVDRMADSFLEAGLEGEWRPGRLFGRQPSLLLGYQRRQFIHNPIKNEERVAAELRVRPGAGTRVDLEASLRPQVYGRHRVDEGAEAGEPRFRPEVHRRWDAGLSVRRRVGPRANLGVGVEGTRRSYREPFAARDRTGWGASGGMGYEFGPRLRAVAEAGFRRTWTRNAPGVPEDRSYRAWAMEAALEARRLPFRSALRAALELEWRRYTSDDPEDDDHYGREDRAGQAELRLTRELPGRLAWITALVRRWRSSNLPVERFDEEQAFSEAVLKSGLAWTWEPAGERP
jgi:hypothetical protein